MNEEDERKHFEFLKKSCLGKIKHKYESTADYVLSQMGNDVKTAKYWCENCENWHIGNSDFNKNK